MLRAYDAGMTAWRQSIGDAFSKLLLVAAWPFPRYPTRYETTIETLDPRTGEPRWRVVGYLDGDRKIIIIAPHGRDTDFVQEALAAGGAMRVIHLGHWRNAHLHLTDIHPEVLLDQMPPRSRRQIRAHATEPCVVEVVFDADQPH